ncbi:thermonuclease family protein [Streptomyces sp. H27-H1]|uniref:thermonuclease family protein n=1 Tax=unclassified Streptomyces TaxID=2593676 RepID=UPI002270EC48|nr:MULTISPECIES: thermonuclease family protein [unclassified Streptomyces]MCY0929455.1 thermonuclease family protein [Streptomyces sp. H27-H1]MCY0938329.1 thermonuclease family protein [Streptomyces sp. H34-S4]
MPMLLIQGSFDIIGAQPDGDSIHFTPDDPSEWNLVGGSHPVQHNGVGTNQLRLDAIDALETHYSPHRDHQPLQFAHAARNELLAWLGFTGVQHNDETVTAATPAQVPGFILTRGAERFGRCVALVGKGAPPAASGTQVVVDVPLLRTTVNHHLLATGLAYPTYYRNLFPDLRDELTAVAQQARADGKGLWPQDVTTTGAKIAGLSSITNNVVILPKLFRRLVDYLHLGDPSLAGFPAFLAQKQDKYFILSTGHPTTGLDFIVQVTNGQTIKMTHPAEDLVFDEG